MGLKYISPNFHPREDLHESTNIALAHNASTPCTRLCWAIPKLTPAQFVPFRMCITSQNTFILFNQPNGIKRRLKPLPSIPKPRLMPLVRMLHVPTASSFILCANPLIGFHLLCTFCPFLLLGTHTSLGFPSIFTTAHSLDARNLSLKPFFLFSRR